METTKHKDTKDWVREGVGEWVSESITTTRGGGLVVVAPYKGAKERVSPLLHRQRRWLLIE
jgi:hypothetical protein